MISADLRLGALLVDLGLIDEAELYAVLARQGSLHQAQAEDVILFLRARLATSCSAPPPTACQPGAAKKSGSEPDFP